MIDTPNTFLYLVLGNGRALRYGIGVGREGFTWAGVKTVEKKAEWPDWHPPAEMIERQPYLPRFMAGGPGNPLGARAMYLSGSVYRIHGTNAPETIGQRVSSGCIRLTNEDVERPLRARQARRQGRGAADARLSPGRCGNTAPCAGSSARVEHIRRTAPGGIRPQYAAAFAGLQLTGVASVLSKSSFYEFVRNRARHWTSPYSFR